MPELLDKVRTLIRIRHYSYRTEQTYIHWIKQFIHFHNERHLAEWVRRKSLSFFRISPSPAKLQRQTGTCGASISLSPNIGIYLPWLGQVVRAKKPARLPVVITREEVRVISPIPPRPRFAMS